MFNKTLRLVAFVLFFLQLWYILLLGLELDIYPPCFSHHNQRI